MSILNKETVTSIAEATGINLADEAASALIQDVEYRLRELLLESKKFMTHSRRRKLSVLDVNAALAVKNVEPIYGYNSWTKNTWKQTTFNNQPLYFVEDAELDLDEIINQPLPAIPLDVMYTAHWLAIDGVQPAIPQNPTTNEIQLMKDENNLNRDINQQPQKQQTNTPLVKQVLSRELTIYYEKVTDAILPRIEKQYHPQAQVKNDNDFRVLALDSIGKDPGLQPLVPYFAEFVSENITFNLKNLGILTALMRTVYSLFMNVNLNVEPHLHQIIPSILTCTISKILSSTPREDHWSLRRYSSSLLGMIVKKYSASYATLQPRLTKTLLKAFLDPTKTRGTIYGAIFGLGSMGEQVVRLLLTPNVAFVAEGLKGDMDTEGGGDEGEVKRMEAKRCFEALVVTIMPVVKADFGSEYGGDNGVPEEKRKEAWDFLKVKYGVHAARAVFGKIGLRVEEDDRMDD